ncbi:class I adenylate-forming enzyme family protein [Microbacterium sp. H1-D42]|uniref:class I adenylate-forming enzyme family protein n=1 Tax=Microbacterium sp. H1-D42 TaxID=2925844 RepID=UPI001F5381D6|nr:class I adenylate-forming enzyme family protein [Microbacterium sp. H1-D42]UNK71462.1 acyl--CoA ligase [Microbacterium sp. H1-D42]
MPLTLPRLTTFADYLDHYAASTPGAPAVWHDGSALTYVDLAARVEAMASSLAAVGVQRGDRIAVLCTPRPEYLISLLAAARLGAVWVGLNPRYTLAELAQVVSDSRPSVILAMPAFDGRAYADDVERLTAEFGARGFGLFPAPETAGALPMLPPGPALLPELVGPDDPAVIVYTSGSSGTPKGAVLSHRGLVYAAAEEAEVLGIAAPRVPCNLPINHVACIADLTGTTLVAGGMLALLERFDPAEILSRIAELRLTNLMNVPTVLQALTLMPEFDTLDLSSLQAVVWGGAPLPVDTIRRFRERGVRLMTVYGMTETTASITFTDSDASTDVLAHTVGRPDPNIALRIMDESGVPASTGEQGEVQVRHIGLFLEYFGRPGATRAAYTDDGWFRTGDIGVLRADGNLQLVGRSSDMIKSGGYNVYPREIELRLEECPEISLAAVIGRRDETFGEVGIAYLVPAPGAAIDVDALRATCRETLANYKIPKEFIIVDELPLLPVGKVDKQDLRRRARDDASRDRSPSSGSSEEIPV